MALQNAVGDGDASHIALNVQVVVTSDVKDDLLTKAESAGIRRSPTCRVAAPRPRVLRPHSLSHHGLKSRTLQGFLQIGRQTHQRIMKVCSTCEKSSPWKPSTARRAERSGGVRDARSATGPRLVPPTLGTVISGPSWPRNEQARVPTTSRGTRWNLRRHSRSAANRPWGRRACQLVATTV